MALSAGGLVLGITEAPALRRSRMGVRVYDGGFVAVRSDLTLTLGLWPEAHPDLWGPCGPSAARHSPQAGTPKQASALLPARMSNTLSPVFPTPRNPRVSRGPRVGGSLDLDHLCPKSLGRASGPSPRHRVRIVCIGGGPGGLYFAIRAKRADLAHEITIYERNRPDDTFGFGVVFSAATMRFLAEHDPRIYQDLMRHATSWDPFTLIHHGRVHRIGGVGFSAIERRQLLLVLQHWARELGVELLFQHAVSDARAHLKADLVIGSDGVNSTVREEFRQHLRPRIEVGPTHFCWLGTDRPFDTLTFFFETNEDGRFGAHVYPFTRDRATFIVETDHETYQRAGAATFTEADT